MIRVNLLSAAGLSEPRLTIPRRHQGAVWGSLLLVLSASGVAARLWQLRNASAAIDGQTSRTQAELARLTNVLDDVERAAARKSDLSAKLASIDRLRLAQRRPVTLLLALSDSLPDDAWLVEVRQQGAVVQIEGRARAIGAVTDFVKRLQDSGAFDRPVEILSIGRESLDHSLVIRFAVKAQTPGT